MANEQKTKEPASRRPENLQRRFAQDLPGGIGRFPPTLEEYDKWGFPRAT